MQVNMGTADRVIRIIIAVTVAMLPVSGVLTGVWMWLAYLVAAVLLVTSVVGFCPAYRLLGWSTRGQRARPSH